MATLLDESQPALRGYVLGRPHGRDNSGWPVDEIPSTWGAELGRLRLHHTEADKTAGRRAYFKETMEVTKSHQDVLHCDWRATSMKYCSTYNAKFSDYSFATEWLSDDISGNKSLFEYHPCEPEMWLYLAGAIAPPCQYSGTMISLVAPTPDADVKNPLIALYEACEWKRPDMTFLEWLRKSNKDGKPAMWVQQFACRGEGVTIIGKLCEDMWHERREVDRM
eukprot:1343736-Amphidinium_carterae.4